MQPSFKQKLIIHISTEQIAEFAFVMYFANSLIRTIFNWIFGGNSALTIILALSMSYIPVLIVCIMNPRKYLKIDFVLLMVWTIMFLLLTLLFHPEYEYFYSRPEFGVWDHVLIPYRGIYAYLFIRLLDEPKKIMKCMKISGWLMFALFGYQILLFIRRGFWYGVAGANDRAQLSYSVSFGYDVLLFALLFLYNAFKDKKLSDIVASGISVGMILLGGSRGPILFIGVFIVLYILRELKESRRKILLITFTTLTTVFLYLFYEVILAFVAVIIDNMGFSSRFITTLLSGTITSDSGRNKIWGAAIAMIKTKPLGYGAMGSRSIISELIYAGYPHSIVLEILIDYGVIVGGVILLIFLINTIQILFTHKREEWSGIFLVFFCAACSLFISLTYWSIPSFWGSLGIGVCCYRSVKTQKHKI